MKNPTKSITVLVGLMQPRDSIKPRTIHDSVLIEWMGAVFFLSNFSEGIESNEVIMFRRDAHKIE